MPQDCDTPEGRLSLKMLNVGCGDTSHPAWVNLDLRGNCDVQCRDVTEGLPFPDESFDVVYHSHLLEHLPPEKALPFIRECYRVLKPAGIIRVLVPDLEQVVRLYLENLGTAQEAGDDYDWIMLELYDQCVRGESGGRMGAFLQRAAAQNSPLVVRRMGAEGALYWDRDRCPPRAAAPLREKLSRLSWKLRVGCATWAAYLFTGARGKSAFEVGLFRNSGEVHHWMYDRLSLKRLLAEAGFAEVGVGSFFESRIPGFSSYGLDVVNGEVRKPDSLVMEGVKP